MGKQKQSAMLGVTSAAMIAVGYPGEMITQGPFGTRWACWFFSMCVFSYIVYTLLKGLDGAHQAEIANDDNMAGGRTEKAAPLMHLPGRLHLPDDGHDRRTGRRWHPGRLLRLRHHLEVRCRPPHLPHLRRQVGPRLNSRIPSEARCRP